MKKSSIVVVVLAVIMAAASLAKAEGVGVDFDWENNQTESLRWLKEMVPVFETEFAGPVPTADATASGAVLYEIGNADRQLLRQVILKISDKLFDKNIMVLINDEKVGILYNNERVLFVNDIDGNKYNVLLESDDVQLIHFLMGLREQICHAKPQNKGWIKVCYEVIKIVVVIRNGIEVLKEITTWVCNQEWVDNEPNHPGPVQTHPPYVKQVSSRLHQEHILESGCW